MDTVLQKALDFSNYQQTVNLQRKNLKEQIASKLVYAYNGGIFKIDRELLVFVQTLILLERTSGIILLDVNETPILIDDLDYFKTEIFDRYFSSTLDYYEKYQEIKKKRSVEKLVDL
jgi:hypothetical protein